MRRVIASLTETYERTRRYSQLTETPSDRLRTLLFRLFASRELPNILLGGAITFSINALLGNASATAPIVAWSVYVVSVVNYLIAEEVIYAIKASSRQFDEEPRGIQ